MRRFLIDEARGEPGIQFDRLNGLRDFASVDKINLALTVDQLLDELVKIKPEWAQVVEVKYFLGLSDDGAAELLGLEPHSFQRIWSDARQWLANRMKERSGPRRSAAQR